MFCDPLHKKLNGVRYKTVHFVSQTSFGWGLISACMFSKYFQTFAKWKKLCQYFIAKVQKLFSLSSSYWIFGEYFFFLFVLLPRRNFRDLISEGTFDEPLNLPSKLSVSPVFWMVDEISLMLLKSIMKAVAKRVSFEVILKETMICG